MVFDSVIQLITPLESRKTRPIGFVQQEETVSAKSCKQRYPGIVGTSSPLSERNEPDLLNRLSYSHIEQLLELKEVMSESNLEDALLDRLQDFLLELGHGFCFEARQKRLLIGGEHDQPPIGILLCTRKNHEMVEFALTGMSNTLFVSRYQVELPGKEEIVAFLHWTVEELGGENG